MTGSPGLVELLLRLESRSAPASIQHCWSNGWKRPS